MSAKTERLPVSTLFSSMFLLNVTIISDKSTGTLLSPSLGFVSTTLKESAAAVRSRILYYSAVFNVVTVIETLLPGRTNFIVVQMIFGAYVDFTVYFRA